MFQRFLTLVLISCMLIQLFPMSLKAEQNSGNAEETTSEQIQLNENNGEVTNTETENTDEQVFPDPTVIPEPTDTQETLEPTASFDASVTPGVTEEPVEKQEPVEEPVEQEQEFVENPEEIVEEQETEESIEPIVEETEEPDIEVVDDGITYLFFGSNYVKDELTLTGILSRIETDAKYELIDYVGLTGTFVMDSTDDVFAEVTSAHERLNSKTVDVLAGGSYVDAAGIQHKKSGLLYEDKRVVVYGVTANSIDNATNATGEAHDFSQWISGISDSKTLVVLAESELHAETNEDNKAAKYWHDAFNAAAGKRDVIVVYGGTAKDYLPVGSEMKIHKESGDGIVDTTISYSYVHAGNLTSDHSSVIVGITDDDKAMIKYDLGQTEPELLPLPELQTFESVFLWSDEMLSATTTALEMVIGDLGVYDTLPTELGLAMGEENSFALDIDFKGYKSGEEIHLQIPVDASVSKANFGVYMVSRDNSFVEITDFKFDDHLLELTVKETGVIVYGTKNIKIPETAKLVGLKIVREPNKLSYLKGKDENNNGEFSLSLAGLIAIATFKDGEQTIRKEIDWGTVNWQLNDETESLDLHHEGYVVSFDSTIIGKQEVQISYQCDDVVMTDHFTIWIHLGKFVDESGIGFDFTEAIAGVTDVAVDVIDTDNALVKRAVSGILSDYVAYDITVKGFISGNTATVTLPVPSGMENPAVYYVDEKTGYIENMNCVISADRKSVSFKTSHFSTYVVGDVEYDITPVKAEFQRKVPATKTVWKLVSELQNEKSYLIVSRGDDGTGYALSKNDSSVGAYQIKVNTDNLNVGNYYIEVADSSNLEWTATSGWKFTNGGKWLGRELDFTKESSLSLLDNGDSNASWNFNATDNLLSFDVNRNLLPDYTAYLRYNNSKWDVHKNSSKVYFYEKTVANYTITDTLTYTIDIVEGNGSNPMVVLDNHEPIQLSVNYTTTPEGIQIPEGSPVWSVVAGDAVSINATTGMMTLTGKAGKAIVKVSQEVENQVMTDFLIVDVTTAESLVLIDKETNEPVGDNVVIKSVTDKTQKPLKPNFYDKDGYLPTYAGKVDWESTNESVATVDENGVVTFTGNDGKTEIIATYVNGLGEIISDRVTYTASKTNLTTPSDGTNDFPEYPNEGAVRLDKTLTTVGKYAQTGLSMIELSMAGVPYSTGVEMDVVLMVDMSGSMKDNGRVVPAYNAALTFAKSIVQNEDLTYNGNRIAVYTFNGPTGWGSSVENQKTRQTNDVFLLNTINDDTWPTFELKLKEEIANNKAAGGTPYDVALSKCKEVLDAARQDELGKDRKQFVVFVSDGAPENGFEYISAEPPKYQSGYREYVYDGFTQSTEQKNRGTVLFNKVNSGTEVRYNLFYDQQEYYSKLMKDDEVTIFTVGPGMSGNSTSGDNFYAETILRNIASDKDKAFFVDDDKINDLKTVFDSIAGEIKLAATNVVVTDKITDEFELVLQAPNQTVQDQLNAIEYGDLYIQVVSYKLDDNKNRLNANPIETIYYNSNKVEKDEEGKVLKIKGEHFTYDAVTHIITWNSPELNKDELALRYFLYLEDSVGATDDRAEPGTYETNEWATLEYTNFQDNRVQQTFPIPQVTWNGAQTSYVFYLVNKNGQPVNRAGRVVPFAEAVYVTDLFTNAITWNTLEKSSSLEANVLAADHLPDVYELYDPKASYQIHVFEDETGMDLNNHFIINGSPDLNKSTFVFNKKSDDKKYSDYTVHVAPDNDNNSNLRDYLCKDYDNTTYENGVYSYTGKEETYKDNGKLVQRLDDNGRPYTIVRRYGAKEVEKGFDFANTIVAFAVKWIPALVPDTVVIDYGLPVHIDVAQNDALAAVVKGIGTNKVPVPNSNNGTYVDMNHGTYKDPYYGRSIDESFWKAAVENDNTVSFEVKDMSIHDQVDFYYESEVTYYESDKLQKSMMYSSVTVIPATSIYYEDSFVKFDGYAATDQVDDAGAPIYSDKSTIDWEPIGTPVSNAIQQTDRPGPDKIGALYDADNVYGYDEAYKECSTYSLGSAMKFNASLSQYGTASFEFYGTGFDVISLTSNETGTILVDVYDQSNSLINTYIVDTYYGYSYTNGKWQVTTHNTNALYQIPVISVEGLTYGKYKAVVSVIYSPNFDHHKDGSYDFYLDAIRVFDPAGDVDAQGKEDIKNAYIADGEYKPNYYELRNQIITASKFIALNNNVAPGIVFVDGIPSVNLSNSSGENQTSSISDYKNFGPNNELYLTGGQAVSFDMNAVLPAGLSSDLYDVRVQIGLKSPTGEAGYQIFGVDTNATEKAIANQIANAPSSSVHTATEMYYDITDLNGKTVVIQNTSGMLSITNIKITAMPKETTGAASVSHGIVNTAMITPFMLGMITVDAEEELPLFTVNPVMTRKVLWALNGGRQSSFVEAPSDDQKLPLGPEAPEDELVEVIDPTDLAVDPGDLPEIAEKREESILEQLKPEDFFEKFNVFDAQSDNIFMRILSFIANFFAEFVLWLKKLLGF